ncbi:CLUMA_CG009032, isoform A [Clunio marinus]|uniref:CLUMA_CG009029, isoform A n=1 Tax=Clunio marinus TaxID=568069 RepID=A0A1J1I5L8_9DIPT|nr:CLUMA_CG009029, isoform A [Clunio marinus]CRK95568.1 CLUMA_CG009032, isoform A [Clunio marinus]
MEEQLKKAEDGLNISKERQLISLMNEVKEETSDHDIPSHQDEDRNDLRIYHLISINDFFLSKA